MRKDYFTPKNIKWIRRSNFLYIFCAWNAFGLCIYQWYTGKYSQDEEWKQLSMTQKYLSWMTDPDDKLTVVNIKGFSKVESKEVSVEEYLKPQQSK